MAINNVYNREQRRLMWQIRTLQSKDKEAERNFLKAHEKRKMEISVLRKKIEDLENLKQKFTRSNVG